MVEVVVKAVYKIYQLESFGPQARHTINEVSCQHLHSFWSRAAAPELFCCDHGVLLIFLKLVRWEDICPLLPVALHPGITIIHALIIVAAPVMSPLRCMKTQPPFRMDVP